VLIRRAIVAGCAVALLACACSGSSNKATPPTTTKAKRHITKPTSTTTRVSTTVPTGTGPTIATTTTVPRPKVADLILSDAGPGFLVQPDAIADTGPTNIAKAADDDVSANAGKALRATKFLDGYQRQWLNAGADGNNNNDFIFLYEFATPGGAELWAQQWRQTLENTPHAGAALTSFSPAEIPGAMGLSSSNKSGSTGAVIFSKGNYAVQVIVNNVNLSGGASTDQSGAATALAVEQYQRLP
jgi:hypothetical protein